MKKKQPKNDAAIAVKPDDSPSATATRVFTQALKAIDDEIAGLVDGSIKPKKYGKVERIAYLAKQAATFAAEERKARALEEKGADKITKAIVLAWARKLEPAERAQLAREIQELDHHRSSLG